MLSNVLWKSNQQPHLSLEERTLTIDASGELQEANSWVKKSDWYEDIKLYYIATSRELTTIVAMGPTPFYLNYWDVVNDTNYFAEWTGTYWEIHTEITEAQLEESYVNTIGLDVDLMVSMVMTSLGFGSFEPSMIKGYNTSIDIIDRNDPDYRIPDDGLFNHYWYVSTDSNKPMYVMDIALLPKIEDLLYLHTISTFESRDGSDYKTSELHIYFDEVNDIAETLHELSKKIIVADVHIDSLDIIDAQNEAEKVCLECEQSHVIIVHGKEDGKEEISRLYINMNAFLPSHTPNLMKGQ